MAQRSIATVSIGGTLLEKLTAISAAGFDGVEIFENDLLYFDGTPADVRRIAEDLGMRIVMFQPFRDFEAGPRDRLQRNLDRAKKKFDIMDQLGTDLMLACSSVQPNTINDDEVAAHDLRLLGEHAAQRGLRVCYEALAWGRHVNTFSHAWKIVQAANHPAIGLALDSFHTLCLDDDIEPIAKLDGERIFMVQIADAPRLKMDVLNWSRHYRCFPGQGTLPVTTFTRKVFEAGYTGPLSLEIFNDDFRAAPPRQTAADGLRSLILLEEQITQELLHDQPSTPLSRMLTPPEPPVYRGFEFIEFAVDADAKERLATFIVAMGFRKTAKHRSKEVSLYQQGDINLILNAEHDSFAHSYFIDHGPSVCALALRVEKASLAVERAARYKVQTFREHVGPNELVIPAVHGIDGSLVYLVERFGARGSIYDVDFLSLESNSQESNLMHIDHVSQVMPGGHLPSALLLYKSVFGFIGEPQFELFEPGGLVQSQAVCSPDFSVRIPLNASSAPNTASSKVINRFHGAGVHHIALATDDIFKTVATMRDQGVPLLDINEVYYDNLEAATDLPIETITRMRALSILYDKSDDGEFFQAYTRSFDNRFFFEILQRKGYGGYGAANATVRMAAQAIAAQHDLEDFMFENVDSYE